MKTGMKVLIGFAVALGIVCVLVFSMYSYLNKLRNTNIQLSQQLSAQYLSNQNYLSEFISGFYEQIGVANLKSDKMDKILTDAVKGRYGEDGFKSNGAFFSAIREAYPDISALNVYDKIIDYVQSRRAGYRDIQDKLLDQLRAYDTWRKTGYIQSFLVKSIIGAPNEDLKAVVGDKIFKGQDALDKMYQIVLTDKAVNAYTTGRMAPLFVTDMK